MEQVSKRRYKSPAKLNVIQQQQQQIKDESYFIVSPSKRYFKRVFNREYVTEKKHKPKKAQQSLIQLSKSFVRSPHFKTFDRYSQVQQSLHQKQNEQSLNNFSMGLFKKSNGDNNSLFDSTSFGERKSRERKLNFNKIFIVQQNSPFKQVIQLSERQLENKEMLEKAVQQLQKRKFQKKFKMLKKQMRLDLSKHKKLDQSIEDLRSHRIGYKTFYKKQVLSQRQKTTQQEGNQRYGKAKLNTYSHQKLNTLLNHQNNQEETSSQQLNIFLQNECNQTRKRNKTNIDLKPKEKLDSFQSIPRQKRRRQLVTHDNQSQKEKRLQLPIIKDYLLNDTKSRSFLNRDNLHSTKKQSHSLAEIRKIHSQSVKSLTENFKNIRQFPGIIKSSQSMSRNLRTRNSQKLLKPLIKPSKQFTQNSNKCKTEQNVQEEKKNTFNDEFTLLLSRQELQNTLNKSRYEMKKLLCMHIQSRKKQWRKNKSKSYLDDKFIQNTYRQMTKSQRRFVSQLKPIEETPKQMQSSRYFDQIRFSSSALVPAAPTHLLKLHTKQLKKSIKSFVKKVKALDSPRKNLKNSPYLQ